QFTTTTEHLFRINVDVTLADLKHQLDQLNISVNNQSDTRRVTSLEYRKPLMGSDGRFTFNNMKLQNDDDIRTMFSIYSQYNTKGLIELDAKLTRSVEAILASCVEPGYP
ncbi:hypothetical protein A2U01_0007090, partial [Trifolium medium]|nr:hypothetical protein [Trifolium medium]